MTPTYFEEMMGGLSAHLGAGMAFGTAQAGEAAYPYSLEMERKGEKSAFHFRFVVDGPAHGVAAALKKQKQPNIRWAAEGDGENGGALTALLDPPSDFYAKAAIGDVLNAAATALAGQGLKPPESCPLCGLGECDTLAYLDSGCRATHAACLQARLTLPQEDTQPPKRVSGHILTGILGAVLGALIGILPNWAYSMNTLRINVPLYAFVPFLSALVYRLCRGRASQLVAGLSVLLASLAAAFALEQVWYWLYLVEDTGHNWYFWDAVSMYFNTHTLLVTLREMLWALVALLVGFFAAAIFLRRYVAGGVYSPPPVRGKKTVLASAFPLHPQVEEVPPLPQGSGAPAADGDADTNDEHSSVVE